MDRHSGDKGTQMKTHTHTLTHREDKVKQRWERLSQISPHSICGRLGLKVHSKQAWSTLVWNYFTLESIQHYSFPQTVISHLCACVCALYCSLMIHLKSALFCFWGIVTNRGSIMLLIPTRVLRKQLIIRSLLSEQVFRGRDELGALSHWRE